MCGGKECQEKARWKREKRQIRHDVTEQEEGTLRKMFRKQRMCTLVKADRAWKTHLHPSKSSLTAYSHRERIFAKLFCVYKIRMNLHFIHLNKQAICLALDVNSSVCWNWLCSEHLLFWSLSVLLNHMFSLLRLLPTRGSSLSSGVCRCVSYPDWIWCWSARWSCVCWGCSGRNVWQVRCLRSPWWWIFWNKQQTITMVCQL